MELTVSRKTAKNLAVRRKNCQILTVSRKNKSTVKFFLSTICHFESVRILDFYVSCLVAIVRLRRLHILSWHRKQTFGSGPAESYSANWKCLFFARGLS